MLSQAGGSFWGWGLGKAVFTFGEGVNSSRKNIRGKGLSFLRGHFFNALNRFANYLQSFRRCFEKETQQLHLLFARSSSLSMPPLTSPVMIHGTHPLAFARLFLSRSFVLLTHGRARKQANEQDLTDC